MKRFVLDSNLYIDANRNAAKAEELVAFYSTFLPHTYLHAIVAHELLRGATDARRLALIRAAYVAPFETRGRLLTPTFASWARAGEVLALLVARKVIDPPTPALSFVRDVLLAVSCRQAGMTLVTKNLTGFERIRTVEPFDFVAAWPTR